MSTCHMHAGWSIALGNVHQMTLTGSRSKAHIYILHVHTSKRPRFSSVSLYDEPFSSYAPLFGKVQQMTPNDLDIQGQKYQYACYTPEVQIFVSFPLQWAVFDYGQFWESAPNDPQVTLACSRSKIHVCILHTFPRPNFCPFYSVMSSFRVMAQFWEKCTEWPQSDLDMLKVRSNVHICILHVSSMPKFSSVLLYDEPVSSYELSSEKFTAEQPQMTLTCSMSKLLICKLYISPRPKLLSVLLYGEPFSSYARFFGKSAPNDPSWPWHVQGQNTYIHATYTPEAQIFMFRSINSIFWVRFALRSVLL